MRFGSMLIKKGYTNLNNANKHLIKLEYEILGLVSKKSSEIQKSINSGSSSYAFDKLTVLNIGNPQALKQLPLTFPREVIACFLINYSNNKDAFLRAN